MRYAEIVECTISCEEWTVNSTAEQERRRRFESQRESLRAQYLLPVDQRPASTARGLHHTALLSSDVEATIRFYQDLLGFPLTELIENRDYPGSSHFFFDIGNGNLLAFFDFPRSGCRPLPRGPGRAAPHRDQRRPRPLGTVAVRTRRCRCRRRGAQRGVAVLPRPPRRRPRRADRRPARRDVRAPRALTIRPAGGRRTLHRAPGVFPPG